MADTEACALYFRDRASRWIRDEGSVAAHVQRLGPTGLAEEFRTDDGFLPVSRYLHSVGDMPYVQDAGYAEFRSLVRMSLERAVAPRSAPVSRRDLRIIVDAALLACGLSPVVHRTVRIVGALPRGP